VSLSTLFSYICYDYNGDYMETYTILKDLRENRELRQQDIADILNIGRTMYRRYETGEIDLPIRHLKTLCLYYGVSADYILGLPGGLAHSCKRK